MPFALLLHKLQGAAGCSSLNTISVDRRYLKSQRWNNLGGMAGAIISQCSAESIAMVKEEGQDFGNKFGNPVYLNIYHPN